MLNRVLDAKVAMFDTKDPKDLSQVDKSTMAVSGSWMILQLDCEPDKRVAIPLRDKLVTWQAVNANCTPCCLKGPPKIWSETRMAQN